MAISTAYSLATGADEDDLESDEARNGAIHLVSLLLTKAADGVIDPKLVLSSVLTTLGVPNAFIGMLVPVREAGALAPQILMTPRVEASETRRQFWSLGSAVQGIAAVAIAVSIWLLEGAAAGWAIVGALAVLSVARALCSVTYKDALARSIPKTRRGAITGAAASLASGLVLTFAAFLATGLLPPEPTTLAIAITCAAAAWLMAAAVFMRLSERAVEPDGKANGIEAIARPLRTDAQLRRFILTRALLTGTALAPPFLLLASTAAGDSAIAVLGPLMIGSAAASILSSFVWGRLTDISSRKVLAACGGIAAFVLGLAGILSVAGGSLGGIAGSVAFIFFAQIAYEGVRAGRKLHLTDMADDQNRTRYTALSNTIIGAVLVAGAGLGFLADAFGAGVTLLVLAAASALAAVTALGLEEVQQS